MNQQGNSVTIVKEGRVTSVPIQRVIPYVQERNLETVREEPEEEEIVEKEKTVEENDKAEEEQIEEEGQKGLRPKKGSKVKFQVEGEELQGIIKQVGKKTGKDKNRCWVQFQDETTRSFDFVDEVEGWKNVNMVHFCENSEEKETSKEVRERKDHGREGNKDDVLHPEQSKYSGG